MGMMFEHEIKIGKDRYHELSDMSRWCSQQYGPGGYLKHQANTWYMETIFGESVFYFKKDKDATAFVLRWL